MLKTKKVPHTNITVIERVANKEFNGMPPTNHHPMGRMACQTSPIILEYFETTSG